jgi:hypothetical protein
VLWIWLRIRSSTGLFSLLGSGCGIRTVVLSFPDPALRPDLTNRASNSSGRCTSVQSLKALGQIGAQRLFESRVLTSVTRHLTCNIRIRNISCHENMKKCFCQAKHFDLPTISVDRWHAAQDFWYYRYSVPVQASDSLGYRYVVLLSF